MHLFIQLIIAGSSQICSTFSLVAVPAVALATAADLLVNSTLCHRAGAAYGVGSFHTRTNNI